MKQVVVPMLLFVVSAFLSLSAIYLAIASFIVGAVISVLGVVHEKRDVSSDTTKDRSGVLLRSGVVLMAAPILTVVLVMAGMSGFF